MAPLRIERGHGLSRQSDRSAVNDHDELCARSSSATRAPPTNAISTHCAALFHPDATIEGARGAQSLAEWLDTMRAPRAFPASMHMLGDPLIELDWRRSRRLDTYGVVYQLGDAKAGQGDLTLGIRYRDRVERGDEGWLIRARVSPRRSGSARRSTPAAVAGVLLGDFGGGVA